MITVNKKQLAQKEKQLLFTKDIVTKNPVFGLKEIEDFFALFNLYCDYRRECDVQDILNTAKTLGFEKNYPIVYDALLLIAQQLDGEWVNFQKFLTLMTARIGHPASQVGRRQIFDLCDIEGKERLTFSDLRKISDAMKYNLTDEAIQQIIISVAGQGKRDINWEQFNDYLAKRADKKSKN